MKSIRLLLLIAFFFSLLSISPGHAAAAGITVDDVSAVSSFPTGVTFSVTAESTSTIVKAELLYQRAEQETMNLVTASFDPAKTVDISLPVDFQINYVPPGIQITYHWRLTDDAGDVVESDPKEITWEDTRFDWEVLSTDQVSVYYYNKNEKFSQTILDSAQSTINRLQTDFSVERSRPIRIWVYDSKADFQGSQAPNSQEWIAGTAYPELQVILAVLPEGNDREVGRVVPHEISHQVLYQAARNPFNAPPTWFDEGLAVSAQANGNETFQSMVQAASEDGHLFSVRSLTSEFPYDPADASLAYAESFSVIQFIISKWGNEGIAAIIAAYSDGLSHDQALMQGIGVDMDGLDQLWKESLGYQGNQGVAGATHSKTSGWGDRLLINATSLLVFFALLTSGFAMVWRRFRNRNHDQFQEFAIHA